MLESLNIRNFALIEDLTIDFRRGLNVLTGETGAGKSIIIGALGLILGEKSSSDMVRGGADYANIEALFDISGHNEARDLLQEKGYDISAGTALVRRTISVDGKSRAFVNGSLANLALLKELGNLLVDIHGQHEHQSLLKVGQHLRLLDEFADLGRDTAALGREVRALKELQEQLAALDMDERERQRRLELNDFAVKEIDAAALKENEETELEEEARLLNNFEKVHGALDRAYEALHSSGALGLLKGAARELGSVAEHDGHIASLHSDCQTQVFALEDLVEALRGYRGGIEFSPRRLEEVNERLAMIQGLKRKYGDSIPAILEYRERCARENQSIGASDEQKAQLTARIEQARAALSEHAFALSRSRQQFGKQLEVRIMEELAYLGMEKTVFCVDIRYVRDGEGFIEVDGERIKLFDSGVDYIEFLISPNPGETPRPLRRIASGGEMSRIMLAMKTVLTRGTSCDTLVFDEVDAGIGGKTASAVGRKLLQVAETAQALCITHLPQIASLADHHILVQKSVEAGRTRTEIRHLGYEERLHELARMIGGEIVSDTTLDQAREMIALGRGEPARPTG